MNVKAKKIFSTLTHKITFLKNTASTDFADSNWEESHISFAEIKPICDKMFSSIEGISFGDVITAEYFLFKTRFAKNIDKNMRINFRDRVFEIKRIINEDEKSRMLNIIALEI